VRISSAEGEALVLPRFRGLLCCLGRGPLIEP
jgi:hypothetical protein